MWYDEILIVWKAYIIRTIKLVAIFELNNDCLSIYPDLDKKCQFKYKIKSSLHLL